MEELFTLQFWLTPIIEGIINGIRILLNAFILIFFTKPMLYFTIIGIISSLAYKARRKFY